MNTSIMQPPTPQVLIGLLAAIVAGLALAVVLHRATFRVSRRGTAALFAARVAAVALVWWGSLEILGRWLILSGPWPIWLLAAFGGLLTEVLLAATFAERTMSPPWTARGFLVTRLMALVLLMLMLAAPIWRNVWLEKVDRYVAVLVDDSDSMQVSDPRLSAKTLLWGASRAGVSLKPWPGQSLAETATLTDLARQSDELSQRLDRIAHADAKSTARQLSEFLPKVDALQKQSSASAKVLHDAVGTALQELTALDATKRGQLGALEKRLAQFLQMPSLAPSADDLKGAAQWLQTWRLNLRQIVESADPVVDATARAYLESLPDQVRTQVGALAGKSRAALAQQLLFEDVADAPSICGALRESYQLRLYEFAADARQMTPPDAAGRRTSEPAPAPLDDPKHSDIDAAKAEWRQASNLAAGLKLVEADMPLDRLAGVLVLSDGRYQERGAIGPVAARLRAAGVPISGILVGSRETFQDAAVESISGPRTVLLGDKTTLKARLKCHGFAGKTVTARLWHDKEKVDQRSVKVTDDRFAVDVEVTHQPRKLGSHSYRVDLAIDSAESPRIDTVPSNDSRQHALVVTDDRIQLLIVETFPRWEFRYLRNLFLGRNKGVHVQYVLVRPDQIEGQALPPPVAVSVSRSEATADGSTLPSTAEEWMKFDVIILGDVGPQVVSAPVQRILADFVEKRGGTLVALAGPEFMPRTYAGSTLAGLLPIESTGSSAAGGAARDSAYRLALTAEGERHPLAALVDHPTDALAAWKATTDFQWRDAGCVAKPGAEVLAYALAAGVGPGPAKETGPAPQQANFVRAAPLIAWHRFGAGKVLALTFDETWRLRYRAGDKYHSHFWNQLLRWSTPDKLPAGTARVRLGTDRADYQPGQTLRVRAQLTDVHGDGIVTDDLRAVVLQGKKTVREAALTADASRPGWYAAELGALQEPGTYRVALRGAKVDELIAGESQELPATDIIVGSAESSTELINMEADDAVLRETADLTRGQMADIASARTVLKSLGAGSYEIEHDSLSSLWDRWPILLGFLILLTSEWVIRRSAGLI